MILPLAIAMLVTLALLVFSELWWRKQKVVDELGRKFIHITVGSFVAFWPLFLSWHQIELMGVAFLVVVTASKYLHVFQAIHSVQRPTWGELYFALAVSLTALITHNKWIYLAALLQMSLADGLAAVMGVHFGQRQRYLVFGQAKSIVGTATFFVTSLAILLTTAYFASWPFSNLELLGIAAVACVVENIGVLGLDNLLVPLLTAFVLAHS